MLSTLSLDDEPEHEHEHDSDQEKPERITSEPNLETGGTFDAPVNDSTAASRQPSNDFNESKKKQESASHSDIPQHLSGSKIYWIDMEHSANYCWVRSKR